MWRFAQHAVPDWHACGHQVVAVLLPEQPSRPLRPCTFAQCCTIGVVVLPFQ